MTALVLTPLLAFVRGKVTLVAVLLEILLDVLSKTLQSGLMQASNHRTVVLISSVDSPLVATAWEPITTSYLAHALVSSVPGAIILLSEVTLAHTLADTKIS
jgi:hypothetical protein